MCGCGASSTKISVDSIEISKKNIYLAEGQTAVITAQVYPFNAENQNVIWKSTNENVVTIENGFITAKSAGDAVIEVISEEGGYKDTCNVLVTTASDNLALNDYNNLNMPPKELEPIYENTSQKTNKTTGKTISKKSTKNTGRKLIKNIAKKASAESVSQKESALLVIDEIKSELKNSIENLSKQTEIIKTSITETNTENTFAKTFADIQTSVINGIKEIKQEILDSLENTEQKVQSEEWTVQNKNLDGVTFVVISNKTESELQNQN